MSSAMLARRIVANGQEAVFLPTFEQVTEHLRQVVRGGDLVVTMGAGNVWEIGRDVLANCQMRIAG